MATNSTVERAVTWQLVALVFRVAFWLLRLAFRFTVGQPMDGRGHTNATFFSAGTEDTREKKWFAKRQPSRWAYLPGRTRMAVRWLVVGVAFAWWRWPGKVAVAAVVVLGVAAGLALWRAIDAALGWRHYARYVRPLHKTLSPHLGMQEFRPSQWLDVPRHHTHPDAVVTVALPEEYARGRELDRQVVGIVMDKLGLPENNMDVAFHMVGDQPSVEFRHAPKPPARVTYAEVKAELEAAPETAPVLGIGPRSKVISTDLQSDAPHTLASIGTNGGKSNLAKLWGMQLLRNGGELYVLDYKRTSHGWARGLAGVHYMRDIEHLHNALCYLGRIALQRAHAYEADQNAQFPRIGVIFEEMNATMGKLNRFWKRIKEKEDPALSPAIEAWMDLSFMGREFKINCFAIGQMLTANAAGGNDVRENFGTRILGRYTVNNWKMLVPEIKPIPQSSMRQGRFQVCVAGVATETQVIYVTDEEAREWANLPPVSELAERPELSQGPSPDGVPLPAGEPGETVPVEPADSPAEELPEPVTAELVDQDPEAVPEEAEKPAQPPRRGRTLVTLREAVDLGIYEGGKDPLGSLRRSSGRDPEFPEPAGERGKALLYDPDDLQRWARNRPRAITGSTPEETD